MKRGRDFIGVGVGALIINDDQEVLLLLRNKQPESGFWSIPGGAVEFGETIQDALRREVREEIGVEIEILRLLTVVNHIVEEDKEHWVSPEFLVRITSDEPIKNLEPSTHLDMRWFSLSELPDKIAIVANLAIEEYEKYVGLQRVGVGSD